MKLVIYFCLTLCASLITLVSCGYQIEIGNFCSMECHISNSRPCDQCDCLIQRIKLLPCSVQVPLLGPIASEDEGPKPLFKRTLANYAIKPKKILLPNAVSPPQRGSYSLPRNEPWGRSSSFQQQKGVPQLRGRSYSPNPRGRVVSYPVARGTSFHVITQNGRTIQRTQIVNAQAQRGRSNQKTRFIPMQNGRLSGNAYSPVPVNNDDKVVRSRSLHNTITHHTQFANMGNTTMESGSGPEGMTNGGWNPPANMKEEYPTDSNNEGDPGNSMSPDGGGGAGVGGAGGGGAGGQDTDGANLDISLPLAQSLCTLQDQMDNTGNRNSRNPGLQSQDVSKYQVKPGTACHVFKWTSCPTNGPQGRPCGWYVLKPCC